MILLSKGNQKENISLLIELFYLQAKKDINSKTLEEELLYALQHLYYGEDFDDPNKKFTYEFEAHIFPDIANAILYSKIWNTPLGANIFLTDSSPDFKDAVNNLINLRMVVSMIINTCFLKKQEKFGNLSIIMENSTLLSNP